MEERVLCSLESCEILDIIYDEHIDCLVEIEEVRYAVCFRSILVLQFERVRADIQDACARIECAHLITDRISEVGLTYSTASVDKERVESRSTGLLSDSQTGRARQFIRFSGNERVEGIECVQLRLKRSIRHVLVHRQRVDSTINRLSCRRQTGSCTGG